MEIKLQDSFKYEIIGKSLEEYINRKDSSGYYDVTPEQFASVASAVLHTLESYGDLFVHINNCEDNGKSYLRNDKLEKLADKLQDKNSIETKLDRYCRQGNINEVENIFFSCDNDEIKLKAGKFLLKNLSNDSYSKNIINKEMQELEDLNETYKKIDEILYTKTEPLRNIISEEIRAREPLYFKYSRNLAEDTKNMFTYAMKTKDIYNKAYVMKSVVDRVLEQYFNVLKKVKEDNVL